MTVPTATSRKARFALCLEAWGNSCRAGQDTEFRKYGAIRRDPCVPVKTLLVGVSQARGVSHFETLMAAHGVPGSVQIIPEEVRCVFIGEEVPR